MPGTVMRSGDRTLNKGDTVPIPEDFAQFYSQLKISARNSIP